MSVVPGDLDTARGPLLRVPLLHFLVGLGLLLAAAGVAVAAALGVAPGLAGVAGLHLLLTGWVCVTIAGAMTQFVPVWSGVGLHSRRLARAQLRLLTAGLVGFAACLLTGRLGLLWLAGLAVLAGFWVFAYNLARTLAAARPWDSTEAHFAAALAFLVLATLGGLGLAVGFVHPVADGIGRPALRGAHVTLAVLGVALTTVFGALYQLAPMFTNTDPDGVARRLRHVETAAYPGGVLVLAAGRLVAAPFLAWTGIVLVAVGAVAFAAVLARTLARARAERTPTLARYALVAPALAGWIAVALPVWLRDPLGSGLGGPAALAVLALGVLGFVVTGTLYHIVPFLVWVERYSDRVGLADVPTVEDLYDDWLAAADLVCLAAGTLLLAGTPLLGDLTPLPAGALDVAGSGAVLAGASLFTANLLLVVSGHVRGGLRGLVTGIEAGKGTVDGSSAVDDSDDPTTDPTPELGD